MFVGFIAHLSFQDKSHVTLSQAITACLVHPRYCGHADMGLDNDREQLAVWAATRREVATPPLLAGVLASAVTDLRSHGAAQVKRVAFRRAFP